MLAVLKAAMRRLTTLPGNTDREGLEPTARPSKALLNAVGGYSAVVGRHGPDSEAARRFREEHAGLPEFSRYADGLDRLKRRFAPTEEDRRAERIRAAAPDLHRELKSLVVAIVNDTVTEGDVAGAYLALDKADGVEFPAVRPDADPEAVEEDRPC